MPDTKLYIGSSAASFKMGAADCSIYLGDVKMYPVEEPSNCYDVTSNISTYTARTYVDVYDSTAEKWYKLNNLDQYEEYGVYGEGKNITYYEGKLTIDNGHEWMWNGASWVDEGEVSASTESLPDVAFSVNYNAKDYDASTQTIAKTSGQLVNVDAVISGGSSITFDTDHITITGSLRAPLNGYSSYLNRSDNSPNLTIISKALTTGGNSLITNRDANYNWMYRQTTSKLLLHGSVAIGEIACSSSEPSILSVRVDSSRVVTYNNWTDNTTSSVTNFTYGASNSGGGALFNGYNTTIITKEPWDGDFYWVYMTQNTLTDAQIQQVIEYNEGGTVEYPVEYSAKTAPVTSVTFQSVAEMNAYECPYEGLVGIVGNDTYIYSVANGWQLAPPTGSSYLALTAEEDGFTFMFTNALEYSTDNGTTWTSLAANTNSPSMNSGDTAILKATLTPVSWQGIGTFHSSGTFNVNGNPLSLIYGDNFPNYVGQGVPAWAFFGMFRDALVADASQLDLSETTLAEGCYADMFDGCSELTDSPILPAPTLAQYCYNWMFEESSVTGITCLATDISAYGCTSSWVEHVGGSGVFYKHPSMTDWTTGDSGIPRNWTVEDYS